MTMLSHVWTIKSWHDVACEITGCLAISRIFSGYSCYQRDHEETSSRRSLALRIGMHYTKPRITAILSALYQYVSYACPRMTPD